MRFEDKITGNHCEYKGKCTQDDIKCKYEDNGCLWPMYNAGVKVHYPFFANTYVLSFFYSKLFKDKNKNNFLEETKWGKDVYKNIIGDIKKDDMSIHLFYASGDDTYEKKLLDELKKNFYVRTINFCKYYPRFIFLDFSTDSFLKLYSKGNISQYNSISNFLTEHFLNIIPSILEKSKEHETIYNVSSGFSEFIKGKTICLFTDTRDEAEALKVILEENIQDLDIIINPEHDKVGDNFLNIYFYSAPYNILFLERGYKYLPLQLIEDVRKKNEIENLEEKIENKKDADEDIEEGYRFLFRDFDTKCYLISRDFEKEKVMNKIEEKLNLFFTYIFWKAKETPEHFYEVMKSFNHYSAISQPGIIFNNEYSFSKCLSLHISPSQLNEYQKNQEKDNRISKRLLFESLYSYSHNSAYNEDREKLLMKEIKQVYSLIALNYLMNNLDKINYSWDKIFPATCEALQEPTFNSDLYDCVFNAFIQAQVYIFVNKHAKLSSNPVCDCISLWKIQRSKIHQRLIEETKNYFSRALIKDCKAEDVFLIDKIEKQFELEILFDKIEKIGLNAEQKESIEHLKIMFNEVLTSSSTSYHDIVESNHFGLSSIFRNKIVEDLLIKKTKISASVYIKRI